MVKSIFYSAILSVIFALVSPAIYAANAKVEPVHVTLHYGVFGGGFQAMNAIIKIALTDTDYTANMKAKPFGVLGYILPWAGDHTTKGVIKNGKLVPTFHEKISTWRGDESHTVLKYKDGVMISAMRDKTVIMPEKDWHDKTTDTLTAVVQMLVDAKNNDNCNFAQDVYDGKRRYAITFKDQGIETLSGSSLNPFKGDARKCMVEMKPQKGFDKNTKGYYKIQEQARERGDLPRVWMAPMWKNGPVLPVRIQLKTQYGLVLVHLQKIAP